MAINNEHWLTQLDTRYDQALIRKAIAFASTHIEIDDGLAIADILHSLQCDTTAIAAAILYPALLHQPELIKSAQEQFEKVIIKIISGAIQMDIIHESISENRDTGQQNQIDNLRKMMLAMVDDIRTVLLKLAEQIILLKKAKQAPLHEQKKIAKIILDYYAPLANRLGVGHLKWQLEDGAFQFLHPAEFERIKNAIHMRKEDRKQLIDDTIQQLSLLLEKNGLKQYQLSGRAKHFYSIYKKIERKQIDFENIYDAAAVRILVPTIQDCYTALSLVHSKWPPISAEFDDYIAKPKSNGYQSIHTAVLLRNHSPLEIQIRTLDMHDKAELGVAAHWKYKENKNVHSAEEEKIQLLRNLLDWQKHALTDENKTQLYRDAFHDRVYVFSPAGDVYDLEKGATPLDFAYLIHTNIGHRCRGAKINGALVPLTYLLKTGDHIDIITSKEMHPSRDWLRNGFGFLKTMHALRKVKQWFRKQHNEENIAAGAALWEKHYRQHDLQKLDIEKVIADFNLKTVDALLASLGAGSISIHAVLQKLRTDTKPQISNEKLIVVPDQKKAISTTRDFNIGGSKQLLTQLAHCCHPIPGDPIMGYITQGHGITVHQKYCKNIEDMRTERPERLINMDWENHSNKTYQVDLLVQSEDRTGLLHDLSGLTAQIGLPILSIHSHLSKQNNTVSINLTLDIKNTELLDEVLKKIRQIHGVFAVTRK